MAKDVAESIKGAIQFFTAMFIVYGLTLFTCAGVLLGVLIARNLFLQNEPIGMLLGFMTAGGSYGMCVIFVEIFNKMEKM
jgi:hypothetical protein